ncbi:MAG: 5'-3' exonuclease H3TH domain-containing protein [Caldilineaceae bacterium]
MLSALYAPGRSLKAAMCSSSLGDRDMFQPGRPGETSPTHRGPNPTSVYGPDEVAERYGLTPTQFIDLKALTGDTSDNIPGVPGVGDKTAAKFLTEYGTLENLYAHIDDVSGPKTRQNLIDAKEQVELNKQLVTIVTDLDMMYDATR